MIWRQPEALMNSDDVRRLLKISAISAGIITAAWLALYFSTSNAHAGQRSSSTVIGSRPAGCPARFCGCALSLKLFGRIIPKFNLAANWKELPRTSARPGAVASRPGHVFQLISQINGSRWLVWDPNSGGGKIRIHERKVAGYTFHDPFASRVAMR